MKDFQPPGLPEEFRPWEEISKDSQMIKITCDKRRYGKLMTIVEGFDTKDVDINEMAKKLKKKTASGGTVKNGKITSVNKGEWDRSYGFDEINNFDKRYSLLVEGSVNGDNLMLNYI